MRSVPIGLLLAASAAVAAAHPVPEFTCVMADTKNGWCDPCGVGYLATVEIRSYKLFDSLDPHGHEVEDPAAMDCPTCRRALKSNGYCGDHLVGFASGHAHFTKLTWMLARGKTVDTAAIECTVCSRAAAATKAPAAGHGWCDACGRGMVGNVEFRDKARYAEARKQFDLLLRSVKELERCETCAMAMFHGGKCRVCDITWRKGEPVKPERSGGNGPGPD